MSGVKRPVLPDRERTSHRAKDRRGWWRERQKEGRELGKEKSVICKELPSVSELLPKT